MLKVVFLIWFSCSKKINIIDNIEKWTKKSNDLKENHWFYQ